MIIYSLKISEAEKPGGNGFPKSYRLTIYPSARSPGTTEVIAFITARQSVMLREVLDEMIFETSLEFNFPLYTGFG